MKDLVLDTSALADLLSQFFECSDRTEPSFRPSTFLVSEVVQSINHIVRCVGQNVIAASALAFVELVHRWDEIVAGRFIPLQLAAFLADPPDWFSIEPMDDQILQHFAVVPARVQMPDGRLVPIEWTDAIHVATVLSRDEAMLVTADERLVRIGQVRVIRSRR